MVAALPAVVVALVLLLFALALFNLMRPLFAGALSQLPVVGGWLAARVDDLIWAIYSWSFNAIAAGVGVMVEVFTIPIFGLQSLIDHIGATTYGLLLALQRLDQVKVPALYTKAVATALQVETDVTGLVWAVKGIIDARIDQAVRDLSGLVWAVKGLIDAEIGGQVAYLVAYADTWGHNLTGLVWAVKGLVDAELGQLQAALTGMVATVDRDLQGLIWERWRAAGAEAKAADDALSSTLRGLVEAADSRSIARDAATAAAATAAAAGALAAVRALEQSPCLQRCDVLGGLGDGLQDLEDLGLAAALIALTAASLKDGPGTASALWSDFGRPIVDLAATVRQEAGV